MTYLKIIRSLTAKKMRLEGENAQLRAEVARLQQVLDEVRYCACHNELRAEDEVCENCR